MTETLPKKRPLIDASLYTFLFRGTHLYGSMPVTRVLDVEAAGIDILRPFPKDYGIQILVHSNDHLPVHIHVQAPPGGEDTRYSWPELRPLPRNRALAGQAEKNLSRYVDKYRSGIIARVEAVYGKGSGGR